MRYQTAQDFNQPLKRVWILYALFGVIIEVFEFNYWVPVVGYINAEEEDIIPKGTMTKNLTDWITWARAKPIGTTR